MFWSISIFAFSISFLIINCSSVIVKSFIHPLHKYVHMSVIEIHVGYSSASLASSVSGTVPCLLCDPVISDDNQHESEHKSSKDGY